MIFPNKAYPRGAPCSTALILQASIRLGLKLLTVTNTLAYYETSAKEFYSIGPAEFSKILK